MASGAALMKVDPGTGEITALGDFDPAQYLAALDVGHQKALAAAYDVAVGALIGPNDVQKEGNREFKKKSAWRKLARHFNISTALVSTSREFINETFVATAVVRAMGPWGQSTEAVGACATDEEVGQRVISIADACATAETRATNRAVSNLIAMGEVSADELGPKRHGGGGSAPQGGGAAGGDAKMPFGKTKGQSLKDLPTKEIEGALEWAISKEKFTEFQNDARAELARRKGAPAAAKPDASAPAPSASRSQAGPGMPARDELPLEENDDDLPF